MMLFRFSPKAFSHDISGRGARLIGGRWNTKGLPVVYTSYTVSLSLLELLIHHTSYEEIRSNYLMQLAVPDHQLQSLRLSSLKQDWREDIGYSRFIGDEFLKNKKSLLLQVPSAIIPEEHNILINPAHPDFKKIKIIKAGHFEFDARLFK